MLVKFRFFSLLVLFGFLLNYSSCRKTDLASQTAENSDAIVEAKFFNTHRTDDPTEKKLVDYIKKQNDKTHFVAQTVKKIGYPRWDKILHNQLPISTSSLNNVVTSDSNNIAFIPFVREFDSSVNASLIVKLNITDSAFKFNYDWQYLDTVATGMSSKNYMLFLMQLDRNVFENRIYKINDTLAFGKDSLNRPIKFVKINNAINNSNSSSLTGTISTLICYTAYNMPTNGGQVVGCTPGVDCPQYTSIDICNYSSSNVDFGNQEPTPVGGPPTGNPSSSPSSGGGTSGGWTPVVYNPAILYLVTAMGTDGNEPVWFSLNPQNTQRAIEMQNYLIQNSNSARAIDISWKHLIKMMNNPTYLSFVSSHYNNGNINKMWWEDDIWLHLINYNFTEENFNFFMFATRPPSNKPQEFADKCEGLKTMALRSKNDNKERLGFITSDNKFILVDSGSAESVKFKISVQDGQLYYQYHMSQGLTTLSYANIFLDYIDSTIRIPIKASVHTHIPGSVPINYNNSRSDADLIFARTIQNYTGFSNYVIDRDGDTYKTASFDAEDENTTNPYNTYLNPQINLTLEGICLYIN